MKTLFWISFAVIAYTYVGYPAIVFLLARFSPRPWRKADLPQRSVSVVMAVHNGVQRIHAQVEHLSLARSGTGPRGDPRLRRIERRHGGGPRSSLQSPRLRTIVLPEQVGKAAALNHGIAAATGEILLFIDIRPQGRARRAGRAV